MVRNISWSKITLGLVLSVALSGLIFGIQTPHVYAQQSSTVALHVFSNTSWQGTIGPVGNQNSINGYGDSVSNIECSLGDSYSVSVQLPSSADASKYVVINLRDNSNNNLVRVASAQGPNAVASFSGKCGDWKSITSNNGLISVQTDKPVYKYGDTMHVSASLLHCCSINFINPTGIFKVISSVDGSVLLEKDETNGCCSESIPIRGSEWEKNTPFYVEFIWGNPNYDVSVYTPIQVILQETSNQVEGSVKTDNEQYTITSGNLTLVTFSGHVPAKDGVVNIGITSPDNTKTNLGFQSVSTNGDFSGSFNLGSVKSLSESGTYSIYGTFTPCCFNTSNVDLQSSFFTVNTSTQQISSLSSQMQQSTIPEFGSISEMIIVISIIGVLTVSRKFRFHY